MRTGKLTKPGPAHWRLQDLDLSHGDTLEVYAFGQWLLGRLEISQIPDRARLTDPESSAVIQLEEGMGVRIKYRYFNEP
jgi:hypothetical protein